MLTYLLVLVWLAAVAGHMFHINRGGHSGERLRVSHQDVILPAPSNARKDLVQGKLGADDDVIDNEIPMEIELKPLISELQVPDTCKGKFFCEDKPKDFDYEKYVEELYNAKKLSDALGPPPLNAGINSGQLSDNDYTNDIAVVAEYFKIHLLMDQNNSSKVKYLIPQHTEHNQEIRQVACKKTLECNKKAYSPGELLEKFSVQMYSRMFLDAVDVNSGRVVKVLFSFKNGCVCRYRKKKEK